MSRDDPHAEPERSAGEPQRRLLVNGRFLTRPISGVDRVATELVRGLIRLRHVNDLAIDLAVPAGAPDDETIRARLDFPAEGRILRSRRDGYPWEQFDLSFLEADATLLSFCNLGPVGRRNQLALIHDAQVYDVPGSYNLSFRFVYRLLQPVLAKRARWVAAVSGHARSRLQANGVGQGRPIEILPNGVDHIAGVVSDGSVLDRHGLTKGGYLLAVGSLAAHKNIDLLVASCEARSDRSVPLVVVGANNRRVMTAQHHQSSDSVRYVGRVSDEELKALYENARLFLFPSLTEGFGLPPLEAMACGCPVLVSTGGAIPEVCGDAAVYCDPFDQPGWTRAVEDLSNDPARLARLSVLGRQRAGDFTWDASARRLLAMLTGSRPN